MRLIPQCCISGSQSSVPSSVNDKRKTSLQRSSFLHYVSDFRFFVCIMRPPWVNWSFWHIPYDNKFGSSHTEFVLMLASTLRTWRVGLNNATTSFQAACQWQRISFSLPCGNSRWLPPSDKEELPSIHRPVKMVPFFPVHKATLPYCSRRGRSNLFNVAQPFPTFSWYASDNKDDCFLSACSLLWHLQGEKKKKRSS